MLTKIRFKNFKSFTKETVISLEPTKSLILEETNVYNDVLKGCAFYGSNASGKTNALNAITILLDLFFKNTFIDPTLFTIFNKEKTMFFEYTFKIDNDTIVYYFEFNRKYQITGERLLLNNDVLLNRLSNSAKSKLTENPDYNQDDVEPTILFLKKIYFNTKFVEFQALKKWIDYLKNSIYYNPLRQVGQLVYFDSNNKKELELITYLDKNGVDDINGFFDEFNFPYRIKYKKENNIFLNPLSQIMFVRTELNDVPFFMESYGNKVLLSILPSFLSIVNNGGILAIDEFSSGLHNKLEELLIKYFYRHSKNAQLIFVSHSTNLLSTSILRPDQIFSTDFDREGSFIKKFSDEKPRESQNLEKMYLSGVFGGIPLYEDK